MRVCLSAEGAKNVSWPWLSPLRGWGSLTMALAGKGTITVNLKKEWSKKGGDIPHERFTYVKFPERNTRVGHLLGDVSKNII